MEVVPEEDGPPDRSLALGFKPQKELKYNNFLPYAECLDSESNQMLAEIKGNLGKAVMIREICPGCRVWTARLIKYIRLYGLKFSKEDHIAFIKMLYELVTIPMLEPYLVNKFASTLVELLAKKELIALDELELPWQPLYELRKRIIEKSNAQLGMYRYFTNLDGTLGTLTIEARHYFPASATQEILDMFQPKLCPFDSAMSRSLDYMSILLPVMRRPELEKQGYELWFTDFMEMWELYGNGTSHESELMWLISRVAHLNIGYIDWEPHMALMFTRFQRSLNLPVLYKKTHSSKVHKLDMSAISLWIVSTMGGKSSTQKYFEKFMKTLETYLQPANFGRWVIKLRELIRRLIFAFTARVNRERVKKVTWEPKIPESHRLTDDDITRFVEAIQPVALQAMYSKTGALDMVQVLQNLATLRPNLIVPPVIEKMYMNLDTITEPHKLTVSMMCVVAAARPMLEVRGGPAAGPDDTHYHEGPSHVLPLLMSVLPGIDPNDSLKCFVTFQFISTFASMVPLVDCSRASEYWKDLTEEEEMLCAATAGFEDFLLQFMDRCFVLIESSAIDQSRQDQEAEKWDGETLTESALLSTLVSVLTQTSPSIFQAALRKLHQFVISRILETSVAGMLLAVMCQAFAMVNAEATLHILLPPLCENVMQLTEAEEIVNEPHLDNELLYNMLLLAELVNCDGCALVKYVPTLEAVLNRTLRLVSREGQQSAGRLLCHMLDSLVHIKPTEYRSTEYSLDEPLSKHLPIRDWARPVKTRNMQMEWHVPNSEEVACVQELVSKFLPPQLSKIEAFINDETPLTREELQGSLNIIMSILAGRPLLPLWKETPVTVIESAVSMEPCTHTTGLEKFEVCMPDGSNVRLTVARVVMKLQEKLLEKHEDDTKSFFLLVSIYELLLCNQGYSRAEFDNHCKNFNFIKQLLDNKLMGRNKQLRRLVLDRAVLQHKRRLSEASSSTVTATHRDLLLALLSLATSQYSEVRGKAQGSLCMALNTFPFSYRLIMPKLVETLKLDSNKNHEQFKGALYVLLGPKQTPLVSKHNWEVLSQLWLALVNAQPSEKLSVIRLMENLVDSVHKHFPTITIMLEVPDSCSESGKALWRSAPTPSLPQPSDQEVKEGVEQLAQSCQTKLQHYNHLSSSLLDAIENGNLHWRYHAMAVSFLRDLVHPDVPFPPKIVKFFLETLNHDSINLRKIAICTVIFILQQQKRTHPKVEVDPYSYVPGKGLQLVESGAPRNDKDRWTGPGDHREDTTWLQYCHETRPTTKEQWDQPRYQHRPYIGFHSWPKKVEVYVAAEQHPPLDRTPEELGETEAEVHTFFSNQANIDKFISFLALEEKKGRDKFNGKRYILFKDLFRNHGDTHVSLLMPHLERLVADKNESSQRCAAEIIAGLIKGSKHWPFEKVEKLWGQLCPVIRTALANMTVETVGDWGICFATASESRDPNRQHWLLELLMEDPLREEAAFKDCGRLYALQGALNQHEWRVAELLHRLLKYLKPFLTHPFQNVRERLGSVLTNIFNLDIEMKNGCRTRSPHVAEFIEEIMPRLEILYQDGPKMVDMSTCQITSSSENDKIKDKGKEGLENDKIKSEKVTNCKTDRKIEGATALNLVENKIEGSATGNEARDVALCLLKTVCRWASGNILRSCYGAKPEFYQLFPLACLLESYEGDDEISKSCNMYLAHLAFSLTLPARVPAVLAAVHKVLSLGSWKARSTCLDFLQVLVFHNMPTFLSRDEWVKEVTGLVLRLLRDERLEVREKAAQVLGGLLHCDFVATSSELLSKFTKQSRTRLRRHEAVDTYSSESMIQRHSGVLGLCAFIDAYPYDVPDFVPDVFSVLGDHLNDPPPISATIRKTLGNFKRTHHDNWQNHKLKFSEDQLGVLSDLLVPPTYYA